MTEFPPSRRFAELAETVPGPRRVAVLLSRLSAYMSACLKQLKNAGTELLVVHYPVSGDAPFDQSVFDWIDSRYVRNQLDRSKLLSLVDQFAPDAIYMAGWLDADYLYVTREMRKRGVLVIAGSDAQWSGTIRQQVGRVVAPWYLHRSIDVLWVTGERQRQLAGKLGYRGAKCWSGVYSCDWPKFGSRNREESKPPFFLFVGRYVPVKGLDILIKAYSKYRRRTQSTWPLVCAGGGDLGSLLTGSDGVENRGFIQPDDLPELMSQAGAFVLPSRKEPWGVVIHEAAAAGLPIICSDACGASVHLVQDGYNGFVVEAGSTAHLEEVLARTSRLTKNNRLRMGQRSRQLSRQYTPERWADTFINGLRQMRANK